MSVSGSGTTTSGGTIKGSGTTEGCGEGASISMWGPLLAFNLVVEFFHELWHNYQGVRTEWPNANLGWPMPILHDACPYHILTSMGGLEKARGLTK